MRLRARAYNSNLIKEKYSEISFRFNLYYASINIKYG